MSLCDYVDNSWSVVQARADKAGEELARALCSRTHRNRPVTLIGFGMGARVIIKCLLALEASPFGHGIVETAVLMGTPYPADALEYAKASSVCAYRLVNAFNSRDWLLSFAYRSTSRKANVSSIAGLGAVDTINGSEAVLENVDLTGLLTSSHFQYRDKLMSLVQALGAHTGVVNLTLITSDNTVNTWIAKVQGKVPLPHAASTFDSLQSWTQMTPSSSRFRSASEEDLVRAVSVFALYIPTHVCFVFRHTLPFHASCARALLYECMLERVCYSLVLNCFCGCIPARVRADANDPGSTRWRQTLVTQYVPRSWKQASPPIVLLL